jgi:hypothetical protein
LKLALANQKSIYTNQRVDCAARTDGRQRITERGCLVQGHAHF